VFFQDGVFVTDNKKDTSHFEICPLAINYKSVMLYSAAPGWYGMGQGI
jgi:hypothetical protein